jgi:RHS repeat-associated protein
MYVGVTSLTAANGYTIRNGDVLTWRQYQHGSTTGGLILYFTDHTEPLGTQDTDGQLIDQDTTMDTWHVRTVDLSQFAGKTIQLIDPFQWTAAPAGNWDIYYGDISLVSNDGSFIPIYSRSMTTLSLATNATVSNFSAVTEKVADGTPLTTTTYYHGDQVGSTHLMTAGGGWPVSSSTYYPFGQEQSPTADPNHYKYTGLERDGESGLDHAQFRQYSSAQGRWMHPDPYMGSYDFTNPQSFNRYTYVMNNPLRAVDPSGLNEDSFCGIVGDDDGGGNDCGGGGGGGDVGGGGGGDAGPCGNPCNVTTNPNPPVDPGPDPGLGYDPFPNQPNPGYGGTAAASGAPGAAAPNNPTQPGKQSKAACNAQRIANAIPGATLTGNNTFQGGHEEYGIQVSGADLTAAGFSFYSSPFGNGNGYRTPFSGTHVNGQPGNIRVPYAYGETFAGQAHFDVGNASSGFGGFAEHSFVDVILGTLLGWIPGMHNFLDPGC